MSTALRLFVWPARVASLALLGALLAAQQSAPNGTGVESAAVEHIKGLPNFHRVNEHLYRGGQPSAEGLAALRDMGVKTVLNLRPPGEQTLNEENLLKSWGIQYINIPMPALGAPSRESVERALDILHSDKGWPVFVHCHRGADRTGTVVACYRMSHDCWTNSRALEEAQRFGLASVQTGKKHFILAWNPPLGGRCADHLIPLIPAAVGH